MHRRLITALSAAILAGAVAAPAMAQTTGATIDIDNCNVKKSNNAGGFTWAYCPIVVSAPAGQNVSVSYRSNLSTYKPVSGASYRSQSGTLSFSGGGDQAVSVKFAFKGKSVSQVTSQLKVTLSNPSGATLTDATATANSASTSS